MVTLSAVEGENTLIRFVVPSTDFQIGHLRYHQFYLSDIGSLQYHFLVLKLKLSVVRESHIQQTF